MAKTKRTRRIVVFSIVLAAIGGGTWFAILNRAEPPISVEKEKVIRRNVTEIVVANGKIEPVVQVKISPEVSGEIIQLPVKEGQRVKKGDLLVKIRPDNYLASRNSAQANYKFAVASRDSAQANLEKADLEYKRSQALYDAKLISESDFLTAKTTYDVAVTTLAGSVQQVDIASATLQSAETDLSKTTIYSPLEGTISKLNSQLGERVVGTAMMAGTEIMTVADLNAMEARVDVGEIDVVLIKLGQKARLEVDSFKDRKFNGVVTDIADSANNNDTSSAAGVSSSANPDATKFQIKIRVTEKETFLPGMSVTADIETRSRTNILAVPIQSVTTRLPKEVPATNSLSHSNSVTAGASNAAPASAATNALAAAPANDTNTARKADEQPKPVEVVFVVQGDLVKMTPVKLGISDDNYSEILDGLHDGDDIVTGGYKAINRDLEDGKKIVVVAKGAAGGKIVAKSN
jgi:HlyD family secretion protein